MWSVFALVAWMALVLPISRGLPAHPLDSWSAVDHSHPQHTAFLEHIRDSIAAKNWKAVDPKDFIGHDKFNIADGFGVDLFIVEEMQDLGDPVLKVEKEMQAKRDKEEVKKKKLRHRKDGWFS